MCTQCEALMINGMYCHEHGCLEAWRDYKIECKWCGSDFKPEDKDQDCCDESCSEAFYS